MSNCDTISPPVLNNPFYRSSLSRGFETSCPSSLCCSFSKCTLDCPDEHFRYCSNGNPALSTCRAHRSKLDSDSPCSILGNSLSHSLFPLLASLLSSPSYTPSGERQRCLPPPPPPTAAHELLLPLLLRYSPQDRLRPLQRRQHLSDPPPIRPSTSLTARLPAPPSQKLEQPLTATATERHTHPTLATATHLKHSETLNRTPLRPTTFSTTTTRKTTTEAHETAVIVVHSFNAAPTRPPQHRARKAVDPTLVLAQRGPTRSR